VSKKRQTAIFDPQPRGRAAILTLSRDYAPGYTIPLHFHNRDQLVFASRGVMTVTADDGAWVVPVHRAVWIPARTAHTIAMSGNVAMRTLYLQPGLAESLARACCVIQVSALLKELILEACRCASLGRSVGWQSHLVDVILDQLRTIKAAPLQISLPEDPRALRVAQVLLGDPSDPRPLEQIARNSGASRRTIERLFVEATGTTFGKWRQQLRLLQALRLLGAGAKVTHAALEAGYSTSSAFIAAFRQALGSTPTRYFRDPPSSH
jgi:AraC-like DNA-binding protein/mannose-6-phosphate isomerase-like protein (cupin superfamily)